MSSNTPQPTGQGQDSGDGSRDDNYILPASQFVDGESRKSSSQDRQGFRADDNAQRGHGQPMNASVAGPPGQRSVSTNARPGGSVAVTLPAASQDTAAGPSSQRSVSTNARPGGSVVNNSPAASQVTVAGPSSQRSGSNNARPGGSAANNPPAAGQDATVRLRNNAWTPGFERAMQDVEAAARRARQFGRSLSATIPAGTPPAGRPDIREAIEDAVEKQVAEALGPLRLIAKDLTKAVQAMGRENLDLHEQNDVMSRQIDLHYRDILQHADMANTHLRALTNMVDSHSQIDQSANENLIVTCTLVSSLSQIIVNLPNTVSNVVQGAVSQATQAALDQVMATQQASLDSLQALVNYEFACLEFARAAAAEDILGRQRAANRTHANAARPQANHAARPQANHAARPQASPAARPQANQAVRPQANQAARSQANSAARPQGNGRARREESEGLAGLKAVWTRMMRKLRGKQ